MEGRSVRRSVGRTKTRGQRARTKVGYLGGSRTVHRKRGGRPRHCGALRLAFTMDGREEDLLLAKFEEDVASTPPTWTGTASRSRPMFLGAACVGVALAGAAVFASHSSSRSPGVVELKGKHSASHHKSKRTKVTGTIDFSVANRLV